MQSTNVLNGSIERQHFTSKEFFLEKERKATQSEIKFKPILVQPPQVSQITLPTTLDTERHIEDEPTTKLVSPPSLEDPLKEKIIPGNELGNVSPESTPSSTTSSKDNPSSTSPLLNEEHKNSATVFVCSPTAAATATSQPRPASAPSLAIAAENPTSEALKEPPQVQLVGHSQVQTPADKPDAAEKSKVERFFNGIISPLVSEMQEIDQSYVTFGISLVTNLLPVLANPTVLPIILGGMVGSLVLTRLANPIIKKIAEKFGLDYNNSKVRFVVSKVIESIFNARNVLFDIASTLFGKAVSYLVPDSWPRLKKFLKSVSANLAKFGLRLGAREIDRAVAKSRIEAKYQEELKNRIQAEYQQTCNGSKKACEKTVDALSVATTHNSTTEPKNFTQWVSQVFFSAQQTSIEEQFKQGYRGFAIDVRQLPDGTYVTKHGLDETLSIDYVPLKDVLLKFKKLLEENPREMIFFNFEIDVKRHEQYKLIEWLKKPEIDFFKFLPKSILDYEKPINTLLSEGVRCFVDQVSFDNFFPFLSTYNSKDLSYYILKNLVEKKFPYVYHDERDQWRVDLQNKLEDIFDQMINEPIFKDWNSSISKQLKFYKTLFVRAFTFTFPELAKFIPSKFEAVTDFSSLPDTPGIEFYYALNNFLVTLDGMGLSAGETNPFKILDGTFNPELGGRTDPDFPHAMYHLIRIMWPASPDVNWHLADRIQEARTLQGHNPSGIVVDFSHEVDAPGMSRALNEGTFKPEDFPGQVMPSGLWGAASYFSRLTTYIASFLAKKCQFESMV